MSTDAANKRRRIGEGVEAGDTAGGGGPGVVSMKAFAEMKAEMALMKEQMNAMQRKGHEEQEKSDGQMDLIVATLENLKKTSALILEKCDRLEDKCETQERRIKYLEARCDLLMRTGAMLLKNDEEWYYSPDISTEYWVERGFGRPYRIRVKRLLQGIKRATTLLRKSGHTHHTFDLGEELGENDAALHCNNALLPHWIEFADALQISQAGGDRFHNLSICGVQLSPAVMTALAPALTMMKGTYSLELNRNEFDDPAEGLQFAFDCMVYNDTLRAFHWSNNPIGSTEEADELVKIIVEHPSVVIVTLSSFGDDINAYESLRKLFKGTVAFASVNLSSNAIRTAGDTAIPDFLSRNPVLKRLVLTNNNLDDEDAILIARALKRNTNLVGLVLGQNDITHEGRNALRNAIYDPTSLNHVSDSNHTCSVEGLDFTGVLANSWRRDEDRQLNRSRKIFNFLSVRNREGTTVHHLNSEFEDDSSSKLVPRVLECVHKHSRYELRNSVEPEKPLSVVYEILRGWKMPSLFERTSDGSD